MSPEKPPTQPDNAFGKVNGPVGRIWGKAGSVSALAHIGSTGSRVAL